MDRFPRERLVRTGDRRDRGRIFAFVKAYQATYPSAMMCRLLDVSTSGYHAWRRHRPSRRAVDDAALTARIAEIHKASDGTYGSPRIHAELRAEGMAVGRKRVARLMRLAALAGVSRRRRPKTTVRDEEARPAPDLVERNFHVEAMDELWVALAKGLRGAAGATVLSHTYVPTATGFLYLAVVLDAFSRRVVGWSMETHLRAELVLQALDMAVKQRRPKGVIHHSDQGSQGGFNRSSQHVQFDWPASTGPELRREFSIRGSCGAVY